jgi:UDP-N-acetyl-D-mannosaminuronic acid dehydrogenase
MQELHSDRRIVIVGGCGHVGLPLGLVLADRGKQVTLLDIDPVKIAQVNAGEMPFMEVGAEPLLQRLAGNLLVATLDEACLENTNVVITVVGTPVDKHLNPNVDEVYRSTDRIISRMNDGALLILRSTVYPGVTKLIADRIHALGRNIPLAFCPERIAEGRAIEELTTIPQLISAFEPDALERARSLFALLAPTIIALQPLEAELAKLFTNSWRYLNFAISNQFYILAQSYGLDFFRIYDGVTRDYPRMRQFAKPGFAAGPCLLKDTLQLAAFAKNNFFMGHAAMLINEGLPNFIVEQIHAHDLATKCVAILGMAFKAESDDPRESLSYKLKNLLKIQAREVLCTDPYVRDPTLIPLETAIERADIIILGAPHAVYRNICIPAEKIVIDVWEFWSSERAEEPSFAASATRGRGASK